MSTRARLMLAALVPLALTAAVYANVGSYSFVMLDDPYYVFRNDNLARLHGAAAVRYAFTTTLGANWHPLVWLSFFADRGLWHLAAGPMHVENAALHAVSGVLVLLLLADATGSLGRATACAALFAVHPMHVESIAWVSERKDALSTVWLLAAACAYVRYARTGRRAWYAGLIGCYVLSLSAKSMGVTLVGVLLLLDAWPLGRLRPGTVWPRVREKLPLLALALVAGVGAVLAQRSNGAMVAITTTAAGRAANGVASTIRYVADLFWPAYLAAFYPYREVPASAAVASTLLLAIVTVAAVRFRRRRPYLLVGWLWFLGTLLPVSGLLVQVGLQSRADRYVYFPSIGLSVAVVWLLADALPPVAARAVAIAAVAALAVAGHRQADTWRSNLALWTHAADVTDDNYWAEHELGREAFDRGDVRAAVDHQLTAIRINERYAPAWADLGRCAMRTGQADQAVEALQEADRLEPGIPGVQKNLAIARAAQAGAPQ